MYPLAWTAEPTKEKNRKRLAHRCFLASTIDHVHICDVCTLNDLCEAKTVYKLDIRDTALISWECQNCGSINDYYLTECEYCALLATC